MLHYQWLDSNYDRAAKSGFFIDFITKKIVESFIRNVFISGGYIFGEKFIIEHVTKNAADRLIELVSSSYLFIRSMNNYTVYFFLLTLTYFIGFIMLIIFLSI